MMRAAGVLFCLLFALMGTPALAGTILDHAGRSIAFEKPFTRIISLYAAHTENLFELGLDRQIIGVSRSEDHPEAALTKPAFNARDGVERFLAARPDLVLIRPMHWRGYPALWQALNTAGIAVIVLQPSSVDEMYAYWRTLGILTGRSEQAARMTRDFRNGLSRAHQRIASVPRSRRPVVFFESIHRKLSTFSPQAMPMLVLEAAGGINAAPEASPRHNTNIASYGGERILAKAGDIDVYVAQVGTMNRVTVADIRQTPGFGAIKAVQGKRIFLLEEQLVSRPTPRLLHGIERLHAILYPRTR